MNTLYTIGHSNHDAQHFLSLLAAHTVSAVADVRSSPYSKYVPQYSKDNLERLLRGANINYLFLGRELGARREEESCYAGNQANYSLIAKLPAFLAGLDRVMAEAKTQNVALMCSEADPLNCHRTILVCRELLKKTSALGIAHIHADASREAHGDAMERLTRQLKVQPDLFDDANSQNDLVERALNLQASRIAYVRMEPTHPN